MKKTYIKPMLTRIGQHEETEKLYRLEHKRNELIKECATEWAKLMDVPEEEFWTRSIPQAMFDILESFDRGATLAAAEAFVEYRKTRDELMKDNL